MKIRGKTLREKKLRRRTLYSLQRIRAEEKRGKPQREAIITSMKTLQGEKFGIRGKLFLEKPEKKAMKELDRKVLPGFGTRTKRRIIKGTRKVLDRQKYYAKYRLIGSLFGGKGKLGIIMVKPDLYPKRRTLEAYLKNLGLEVVFTKNFVFGKSDIQRLYPHTLADREKYHDFAVSASYLMSAPSRVIVFKHLTKKEYMKKSKKGKTREEKPQDVFNKLFKEQMREAISRKNLEELGFPKKKGEDLRGLAKELDVHGYFEKSLRKGFDPLIVMNGIHVPDSIEVVRDARTLLSLAELENIQKKVK